MVQVERNVGDAAVSQDGHDAPNQRLARDRNRRFRAHARQRIETRAEAGGQHERVREARHRR